MSNRLLERFSEEEIFERCKKAYLRRFGNDADYHSAGRSYWGCGDEYVLGNARGTLARYQVKDEEDEEVYGFRVKFIERKRMEVKDEE